MTVRNPKMSKSKRPSNARQEVSYEEALDKYKELRPSSNSKTLAKSSVEAYQYGIAKFKTWMDENEYKLSTLSSWDVVDFTPWLRKQDYSEATLEHYTKAVKGFLQFCEEKGVVESGVADGVEQHTCSKSDKNWDVDVPMDRLEELVQHLENQYGPTRDVLIVILLAKTGLRTSGLKALDVGDVEVGENGPIINVKNREETKLKGRDKHERTINIEEKLYDRMVRYIKHHRIDVEDKNGRKPLFTTENGRISTIRDTVYQYTCPETTGIGTCSCTKRPNKREAMNCDKSVSPHVLRKYHITQLVREGYHKNTISLRVGASPDVIDNHYDKTTPKEKARARREKLSDFL